MQFSLITYYWILCSLMPLMLGEYDSYALFVEGSKWGQNTHYCECKGESLCPGSLRSIIPIVHLSTLREGCVNVDRRDEFIAYCRVVSADERAVDFNWI